jgi:hypothetical protein
VKNPESFAPSVRPIPISLIMMAAVAVHLPLLLMKLPLRSYDTNLHIFFASHYLHHWFDPWNTKWYAGFSQTTYPPLPQQWVALLSHVLGLDFAYMAVQLIAILLLVVGVYRFSLLWVSPRAASFAALASVFLGSESFLVYSAGQLGTTSAAPIYLNALPFMFEWIRFGRWRSFFKACVLFMAAAAAHHATLLFGSFFFAIPVLALAFFRSPEWRTGFGIGICNAHCDNRAGSWCGNRFGSAAVLDCVDSLSSYTDADSACEPRKLFAEPDLGHELFCRSLWRAGAGAAVYLHGADLW